jgi:general secretion pathway protein A
MNPRFLALKWNPFAPGVPTEALHVTSRIDSFRRRVWQLAAEGGFALITGAPGTPASRPLCASSPSIWRSSAT